MEVGHTDVSPLLARAMTWIFIGFVFLVPLIQRVVDRSDSSSNRAAAPLPLTYDIAPRFADAWQAGWTSEGATLDRLIAVNRNLLAARDRWEDNFVERSWLSERFLPPVQTALYMMGTGNGKAIVGRDGWLFYLPGIDYLVGPGFLTERHLFPRDITGNLKRSPEAADPRNAVLEFHRYLSRRGIRLVIVPAPDKATIAPDHLSDRASIGEGILQNVSYAQFRADLEKAGVLVYDAAPELAAARKLDPSGEIDFLRTDSHWTPAAMELVARGLAAFVEANADLSPRSVRMGRRREAIEAAGDLALMLRIPGDRIPEESAVIHPVTDGTGRPWSSSDEAEILFLGDSYANIFSLAGMGWGEGAGLPEQLAYFLERPVDTILRNDAGAYATREMLATELARGIDRLAGKKIVVWEFAARELAAGEWKRLPMRIPSAAMKSAVVRDESIVTVRGRIRSAAEVARPGYVPYKDHIRALHVVDVKAITGALNETDILVYTWSMRDNELTPEAALTEGSEVVLRITPWSEAPRELERINRSEIDDDELLLYDPWWGELVDRR